MHGNCYGTLIDEVKHAISNQKICILDIDIQGAKTVHASQLECNFLFLLPPAKEVLRQRLNERGTETEASLELRLANSDKEE